MYPVELKKALLMNLKAIEDIGLTFLTLQHEL